MLILTQIDTRPTKYRTFALTTDNFYGNFSGNKVEVMVSDNRKDPSHDPWSRVWVGGNDDFALVLDIQGDQSFENAMCIAENLEEPITKRKLYELGFTEF